MLYLDHAAYNAMCTIVSNRHRSANLHEEENNSMSDIIISTSYRYMYTTATEHCKHNECGCLNVWEAETVSRRDSTTCCSWRCHTCAWRHSKRRYVPWDPPSSLRPHFSTRRGAARREEQTISKTGSAISVVRSITYITKSVGHTMCYILLTLQTCWSDVLD